jgi:hypothetical protein
MAGSAVDRFQIFGVRKTFIGCIGMAGETGVAVVDRMCKDGGIHKHGYGSSMEHPGQSPVLMAHHTVLVSLCRNLCRKRTNHNK